MKEVFNKFKLKISENRKGIIAWGVSSAFLLNTVAAHAVGTADPNVTTAFQTASDNIVATLGVVSVSGVAIMVIIMGWRYGKRLFKTVAN